MKEYMYALCKTVRFYKVDSLYYQDNKSKEFFNKTLKGADLIEDYIYLPTKFFKSRLDAYDEFFSLSEKEKNNYSIKKYEII